MKTAIKENKLSPVKKIVFSALFLATALVLPFLTGQIPQLGNMLCPMHLPVLILGFVCGPVWGGVVGFVAPLLRFLLWGMPPFPGCISMAFELAAYGVATGNLYKLLPKKLPYIYLNLVISMIAGRIVWGAVKYIMLAAGVGKFGMVIFFTEGFVNAIPGIILQLIVIPPLVSLIKKRF